MNSEKQARIERLEFYANAPKAYAVTAYRIYDDAGGFVQCWVPMLRQCAVKMRGSSSVFYSREEATEEARIFRAECKRDLQELRAEV